MKKLLIYLIVGILMIQLANAYYSRGTYGSGVYGRNLVIPTERVEVFGGGQTILNTNATPALLAGGCSEGNKYLDGACYPCPDGTLFKRADKKVVCVVCGKDAYYKDGDCIPKPETIFIDYWKNVTPEYVLMAIVIIGLIAGGLIYTRKELKKKAKEKEPKEEDEEDLEEDIDDF